MLGNNDEAFGKRDLKAELGRVGYRVLENEIYEISAGGGGTIRLLGLADHTTVNNWREFSALLKRVIHESPARGDILILEHSPDVVPMVTGDFLISDDLKILFAGHTHGGQVWLPILGAPILPTFSGQKFSHGHVRDSNIDVFVTSGVGTSVLPFRFLVPPEIAVVTIRSAE